MSNDVKRVGGEAVGKVQRLRGVEEQKAEVLQRIRGLLERLPSSQYHARVGWDPRYPQFETGGRDVSAIIQPLEQGRPVDVFKNVERKKGWIPQAPLPPMHMCDEHIAQFNHFDYEYDPVAMLESFEEQLLNHLGENGNAPRRLGRPPVCDKMEIK